MLTSSYSINQIKEAEQLVPFIKEQGENWWAVPKKAFFNLIRFNPKKWLELPVEEVKESDVYWITRDRHDDRPFNSFHCTCVYGTYRDGREEQDKKYCKHVLAVILLLVKKKKLSEMWRKAIYGSD